MKITILTVGKLKEAYLKEAVKEYAKRLGKYCRLEIEEVADEKAPEHLSDALEERIRIKEGERLLRKIPENAFVITLEIEGEALSSVRLAEKIEKWAVSGISHLIFVIGGSIGMGKAVLNRSDYALSFGNLTYPHQLMRAMLLEQIYRSFRIINGEPYHK